MNLQQQQINVDVSQLKDVNCTVCEGKYFQPAFVIKKVSALLSPTGQEQLANIPVMVCMNCKTNLQDMLED
jgi:hypothetical protein